MPDDLIAAVWERRVVTDAALATRLNSARAAIGDSGSVEYEVLKQIAQPSAPG
jgi:DNA-binding winged helix-turn-helix (wHTH) protein